MPGPLFALALTAVLAAGCTASARAVAPSEPAPPSAVASPAVTSTPITTVPERSPSPTPQAGERSASPVVSAIQGRETAPAVQPEPARPVAAPEPGVAPAERVRPAPPAPLPPADGYRLMVPAIGVDAPIVEVGLEADGSMAAPNGPDVVGWFAPGPRPGAAGNVLMDGHVDWADRTTGVARTAVFWRLKDVHPGQELTVVSGSTRFVYRVRESLQFAYDDPSALRVLAPSTSALLTIITCEGNFNAASHNYSHRRVLIAELARAE